MKIKNVIIPVLLVLGAVYLYGVYKQHENGELARSAVEYANEAARSIQSNYR